MDDKIVLIKGNHSEWFEQAIFILKATESAANKDLVTEAEKIINNYMMISGAALYGTKTRNRTAKAVQVVKAETQPAQNETVVKKQYDYASLAINIALILCSILLGYILRNII